MSKVLEGAYLEIANIVYENSGIALSDSKVELVINRVAKRLKALSLQGVEEYLLYLKNNKSTELGNLLDVITTNWTYLNREYHHFVFLKALIQEHFDTGSRKPFKLYSAGCSTGEEILTAAMVFETFRQEHPSFSYEILGVDIDRNSLSVAQRGIYKIDIINVLSDESYRLVFDRGCDENEGYLKVKPSILKNIKFVSQSVLKPVPGHSRFNAIFCRNVLIYFDLSSQIKALNAFKSMISDNGFLFLGHSENMSGKQSDFELINQTIYRPMQ